jgi:hypothetical protein
MSSCSLSYLGGMFNCAATISCGSDAVTDLVTGQIIKTYTTPEGTQAQLPVTKISMSESKGRYNLFTNKNNTQALMDYTAHLLKVIPKWLDGNVNYTGGKILANTTAATQYTRVQPKSNLTQPHPALTAPEQTKSNPPATVSSQQSTTLEIDSSKNLLIPLINQLKNQITTLQATVNSQGGMIALLIQDNKLPQPWQALYHHSSNQSFQE